MKIIKLISKEIELLTNEGKKNKTITSLELLESAMMGYQEGAKGIDNIVRAAFIYNKIRDVKGDTLEIEDADFEMLYNAVNSIQWLPQITTQVPEFFKEIQKAKNE